MLHKVQAKLFMNVKCIAYLKYTKPEQIKLPLCIFRKPNVKTVNKIANEREIRP